jgi:hypothetical protein
MKATQCYQRLIPHTSSHARNRSRALSRTLSCFIKPLRGEVVERSLTAHWVLLQQHPAAAPSSSRQSSCGPGMAGATTHFPEGIRTCSPGTSSCIIITDSDAPHDVMTGADTHTYTHQPFMNKCALSTHCSAPQQSPQQYKPKHLAP